MKKSVLNSKNDSVLGVSDFGTPPRIAFLTEVLYRRPELSKEESLKLADSLFVEITGGKSNLKETAFFWTYTKAVLSTIKRINELPEEAKK